MAKVNVGLRVEQDTLDALEELARLMTARAGGAKVTPTEAARTALARGIAVLLAELGEEPKGGKRAARKLAK